MPTGARGGTPMYPRRKISKIDGPNGKSRNRPPGTFLWNRAQFRYCLDGTMPGLRLVPQKKQKRRFSSLFPTPNLIYKREFLLWQDFQYLAGTTLDDPCVSVSVSASAHSRSAPTRRCLIAACDMPTPCTCATCGFLPKSKWCQCCKRGWKSRTCQRLRRSTKLSYGCARPRRNTAL